MRSPTDRPLYETITSVLADAPPHVTVTGQLPGVVFEPTTQHHETFPAPSVVFGSRPRAPLPFASKRLGHRNSAITADVYSHLRSSEDAKLGEMFGEALGE